MAASAPVGNAVTVDVDRVEKIPGGKNRPTRYRFHSAQGLYLTAQDLAPSPATPRLTGRETGSFELLIDEDSRVLAWTAL